MWYLNILIIIAAFANLLRKRYGSLNHTVLSLLYCSVGGFCFGDTAKLKVKHYYLSTLSISVICCTIISVVGFFATTENVSVLEAGNAMALSLVGVYVLVVVPLLTYYRRNDLESIMNEIFNQFNCPPPKVVHSNAMPNRRDTVSKLRNWFIAVITCATFYFLLNLVYVFLFCGVQCVNSSVVYIYGTPYVRKVKSLIVYSAIYTIQSLPFWLSLLHGGSMILFSLLITFEFDEAFINLHLNFERIIYNTINRRYNTQLKTETVSDLHRTESSEYEKFKNNLGILVERHQQFYR